MGVAADEGSGGDEEGGSGALEGEKLRDGKGWCLHRRE